MTRATHSQHPPPKEPLLKQNKQELLIPPRQQPVILTAHQHPPPKEPLLKQNKQELSIPPRTIMRSRSSDCLPLQSVGQDNLLSYGQEVCRRQELSIPPRTIMRSRSSDCLPLQSVGQDNLLSYGQEVCRTYP